MIPVKQWKRKDAALTHAYLISVLKYNPNTGLFHWRHSGRGHFLDRPAGRVNKIGRREIRIGGYLYYAARLAWFYMTGEWPKAEVDHHDGNCSNDGFTNLREATSLQNKHNLRPKKFNRTGFPNVSFRYGKYCAQVRVNYKRYTSKPYPTAELAYQAYCNFVQNTHKQFAYINRPKP